MKKQFLQIIGGIFVFQFLLCVLSAQTVTLTFTGQDAANNYVQLSSVTISNLTQNWQETITWPDFTLTMQQGTGIDNHQPDFNGSTIQLSQNNPNPFKGITEVRLSVFEAGDVAIQISEISGKIVDLHKTFLLPGTHLFRIHIATAGTYIMSAQQNGKTTSIKMVNNGGGSNDGIDYMGIAEKKKTSSLQPKLHNRGNTTNPFNSGDMMEFVGYAIINGVNVESQHITQAQELSQTIVMQFDMTQVPPVCPPCPGTPTVTDIDGNVYNTIQLGNQCWMRENLRTTKFPDNTMIPVGSDSGSTGPRRYGPNNSISEASYSGYLYNWPAVMYGAASSSAAPSGMQGICPMGWHVPSDAEWTQLTDYVSSQSEYTCGNNATYIAKALASSIGGWYSNPGNCDVGYDPTTNNTTGFSALPAGGYDATYSFVSYYHGAFFWSATENEGNTAYGRFLHYSSAEVTVAASNKLSGYSVRCVRD